MDIKNLTGSDLRTEGTPARVSARNAKTADPPSASKTPDAIGESVTLTNAARTISATRENAASAPFDSARVAEIRTAIAEGRYPIDNRQLADRIIGLERLLT